jgi:hypothetical protein
MYTGNLLTSSAKVEKGEKFGYLTAILYLAPSTDGIEIVRSLLQLQEENPERARAERIIGRPLQSALSILSGHNLCPWASKGCKATCLFTAGRAGIISRGRITSDVLLARIGRTVDFFADRPAFLNRLSKEITRFAAKARAAGWVPCVRLNGTSDIPWDTFRAFNGLNLMQTHSDLIFYDYTKSEDRADRYARGEMPRNYHVTFSRSETTSAHTIARLLRAGVNVAVPFVGSMARLPWALQQDGPATRVHFPARVIDGDESDLRFRDPVGVIVALTAKGKARKDTSGFVVRCAEGGAK